MLQGRKKPIYLRLITVMQDKCNDIKGCMLFLMQVSKNEETDRETEYEETELQQNDHVLR